MRGCFRFRWLLMGAFSCRLWMVVEVVYSCLGFGWLASLDICFYTLFSVECFHSSQPVLF
jgi:hypothetical protein